MEASSERQQQILPDSTTTVIINDKQDFIIMNEDEDGAGLQVAADTDPSLTDLMLGKHNFFLSHSSTEAFMTDQRSTSLPEVLDLTTSGHLLSASTDPSLLSSLLNIEEANMVTSTSHDEAFHLAGRKSDNRSVIILPQNSSSLFPTPPGLEGDNSIYTLTLTDGSIVQLRIQNDIVQQQQLLVRHSQDDITDLDTCCWLQNESESGRCTHCQSGGSDSGSHHDVTSLTPVREEVVTLPLADMDISTLPNSPDNDVLSLHEFHTKDHSQDSLSPVSPQEVMPLYSYSSSRTSTPLPGTLLLRSGSPLSDDSFNQTSGCSMEDDDDFSANDLSSIFASMDNVTIENLKARLCADQPEGPTFDLEKLLVAAKINLTVNSIVSPPLTTVKKIMEDMKLSEWQIALCLKIRRRKKNTAAVRSSRRKRNQYVIDLRQHLEDLRKRRQELQVEHSLLEQLTSLWERLCTEVEAEIQDGVKRQLGFQPQSEAKLMYSGEDSVELQDVILVEDRDCQKLFPTRLTTRGKRKLEVSPPKKIKASKSIRCTNDSNFPDLSDKLTSEDFLLEDEVVPLLPSTVLCRPEPCHVRSGMKLRQTRVTGKYNF